MDDLKLFYKDVNLKETISKQYYKGQILYEKGFIDMTTQRGGPFTSHRYVIISNTYIKNDKMEDEEDWEMYTIGRNEAFKVLGIYVKRKVTYFLVLHLRNKIDLDEKKLFKIALKQIKEDCRLSPNRNVATISWLERCQYPLGFDHNGVLFTNNSLKSNS